MSLTAMDAEKILVQILKKHNRRLDCNALAQAYQKQQGRCIKEDCGVKLGKLVINSSRLSAFSGDKLLSQLRSTFDVVLDAPEQKTDRKRKTWKKKTTKEQALAIQTLVALLRQHGGRMDSVTLCSAYGTQRGKGLTQDCGMGLGALLETSSKKLAAFQGGKPLTKLPPGGFDVVLLEDGTTRATDSPKHAPSTVVVDTVAKCAEVLKSLSEHKVLGLDIEGVDLGSNGTVSLIQLADADGNAYLFDIFKCEEQIWHLKDAVLESDAVVKVVHDVRADSAGLFANYQIKLRSVFDTQVALQYFKPQFRAQEVGMNRMLGALDLPVVADKGAMAKKMHRGRFWETRPLTPSMISYAAGDVRNLVKAFHKLKAGTSRTKNTEHSFTAQCDNRVKGGHVTFAQNSADAESDTYADRTKRPVNTPLPFVFAPTPPYKRIFLERSGPTTAAAALPQQEDTAGDEDEHSGGTEDEMVGNSTGSDPNTSDTANASPPLQPGAARPTDAEEAPPLPPAPHTGALPEDLYTALPVVLRQRIADVQFDRPLVEIVIDRGRDVTLRFAGDEEQDLPGLVVTVEDALQALSVANVREKDFLDAADHRSGIGLHRISAITRGQTIDGLTYRIGRHVKGSAEMLKDVVCKIAQSTSTDTPLSMLLLGRPGVGKTTLLREIACQLSTTFRKRVVVVDTSDEICGYEDQPHACVGRSRRMPVVKREEQYKVLIEAVQNHNPQVVVVDEIADAREAKAVKTITQRGVCVIGTAHGASLSNLMKNPDLTSLIGGLQTVTLGDIAAKERAGKHGLDPRKTATERSGAPPFNVLVELQAQDKWRIHLRLAKSVDAMLAGQAVECEVLQKHADGTMTVTFANGK